MQPGRSRFRFHRGMKTALALIFFDKKLQKYHWYSYS